MGDLFGDPPRYPGQYEPVFPDWLKKTLACILLSPFLLIWGLAYAISYPFCWAIDILQDW